MYKIIFLIFCLMFMALCAEHPSWYPENADEIKKQCAEENQLAPNFGMTLTYDQLANNTNAHAAYLCAAKGFNFYSEDEGVNVDRMIYFLFKTSTKCINRKAKECVETHKEIPSAGEMILKLHYCILEVFKGPETED
ncbi:uncharacterized protein LOC119612181 [Lucilia sericata]|uniref:uncharacterized protein LOC119612181 n=1 Tax=Lucilia sericata TaxID=13632 RepID=UPI0018A7EDB0|nr:uncharacterized protein LOC119612181 [Lucilia sericata]